MKLPVSAHTSLPWLIHDLAHDFEVLDVWALPTPGGPDDFHRLVSWMTSLDPRSTSPLVVRALFEIRRRLGEVLHWDDVETDVASSQDSLRDRLPPELRDLPVEVEFGALPARAVYMTHVEFAAEVINQTGHHLIHLGWCRQASGEYRGQMAILVKPNGLLGDAYLAAIAPFRHLLVYPSLIRGIGSRWQSGGARRA